MINDLEPAGCPGKEFLPYGDNFGIEKNQWVEGK